MPWEDLATGLRCAEANRLCAAMVGCQQGHLGWQAEGIATQVLRLVADAASKGFDCVCRAHAMQQL